MGEPATRNMAESSRRRFMERHGIEQILTFDSGFDRVPGIQRIM